MIITSSNIPVEPAYGVYIFQLMRYSSVYGPCHDFLDRELLYIDELNRIRNMFEIFVTEYLASDFRSDVLTNLTTM
jgi:hypothetical protein